MGCGKSTVGRLFASAGWARADVDDWVRDQILREPATLTAAVTLFGPEALAPSGDLDRHRIARAVFNTPALLKAWEAVIHPRVRAHLADWASLHATAPQLIEIPLLFENGLEKGFDFVVCVASSSETQFVRLSERGMSRALAEQRITKQLPLATKIQSSHFVIWNDGSRQFLAAQVAHLSRRLLGAS
ncbi:dephospho-CoA kinase [Nibricoccus sp. IMCC34717]|uniref:dephospho-CoA kinase n=1 Tax=Nibricoccus sp. IMCC34717 TaxID=3034021 RepID=UPI00384F3CFF